ncbi:MAG: hypothetical protein HY966_07920 [Ignavibacteriales bacterium]|nr:hypothetical protein [Ignavibacteriales bacterium]
MNTDVLTFFELNYAPGRVCLVGSHDPLYELIRIAQSGLTIDGKPSKYNHAFLMSERRGSEQKIFILESDIHFSAKEFQIINGPQESLLEKWCLDSLDYACVLGMDLAAGEQRKVIEQAVDLTYDVRRRYPIAELFGTLWAIITKTMGKKNVFDDQYAIQCATMVRLCYQAINKDPLQGEIDDITNTSPERLAQSTRWTFRKEWKRM